MRHAKLGGSANKRRWLSSAVSLRCCADHLIGAGTARDARLLVPLLALKEQLAVDRALAQLHAVLCQRARLVGADDVDVAQLLVQTVALDSGPSQLSAVLIDVRHLVVPVNEDGLSYLDQLYGHVQRLWTRNSDSDSMSMEASGSACSAGVVWLFVRPAAP